MRQEEEQTHLNTSSFNTQCRITENFSLFVKLLTNQEKPNSLSDKKIATFEGGKLNTKGHQSITLLMGISVDQYHQTGNELEAFCDLLIGRNKKEKIIDNIILVETGYLKRHYAKLLGVDHEIAEKISQKIGDQWTENHTEILKKLLSNQINFKILSWQELTKNPAYHEGKEKILNRLKTDKAYAGLLNQQAAQHTKKLQTRLTKLNIKCKDEVIKQACIDYLIDEAAMNFVFPTLNANNQTYPGEQNRFVEETYKIFFSETNPLPFIKYIIRSDKKTASPPATAPNSPTRISMLNKIGGPSIPINDIQTGSFIQNPAMLNFTMLSPPTNYVIGKQALLFSISFLINDYPHELDSNQFISIINAVNGVLAQPKARGNINDPNGQTESASSLIPESKTFTF